MLRFLVGALVLVIVAVLALLMLWVEPARVAVEGSAPVVVAQGDEVPAAVRAGPKAAPVPQADEPEAAVDELPFVAGRVEDPEGQGIAGARVSASLRGDNWFGAQRWAAVSDEDGRFRVHVRREGVVVLITEAAGHCRVGAPWARTGSEDVVVPMERCGGVRGRVLDPAGATLADARIEAIGMRAGASLQAVLRDWRGRSPTATSGPDGEFELPALRPGIYALHGSHPLHSAARVQVELSASEPLDGVVLTLGPGSSISGRVVDGGGQPIPDTTVAAWFAAGADQLTLGNLVLADQSATTDESGVFVLAGLREGDHVLGAEHPEYYGANGRDRSKLAVAAGSEGVEIVLTRGATLRGHTESDSGETLAGVRVSTTAWNTHRWMLSDASGEFELKGVPRGKVQLMGELALHRRAHVEVEIPIEAGVDPDPVVLALVPAPGLVLAGHVEDGAGAPLAGARVSAGDAEAAAGGTYNPADVTAEDGSFEMRGFAPGRSLTLGARLEGYAVQAEGGRVEATPGQTDVRIVMTAEARIAGRVLAADDAPVSTARITAKRADTDGQARGYPAATNGSGDYEITTLPPGDYLLECSAPGSLPAPPRAVTVVAGERVKGIDFRLSFAGGELRGRVVDEGTGAGIEGVRVHWGPEARRQGGGGRVTSGSDGSFHITGLEDLGYSLQIQPPTGYLVPSGEHFLRMSVRPGDTPVLRLARGLEVRGRAVTESGEGVPDLRYRSLCAGDKRQAGRTRAPDGLFEIGGLPACIDQIVLRADELVTTIVPIPRGAGPGVIDLGEVVLLRGGTVRGVVVDAAGTPIKSARVFASAIDADAGPDSASPGRSGRTDSDGSFELRGVASGTYEVTARAKGYLTSPASVVSLGSGDDSAEVRLQLERGATVFGRATARGGGPLEGMQISAVFEVEPRRWRSGGRTTTDAAGAYEIAGLEPGTYGIRMEPPRPTVMVAGTMTRHEVEQRIEVPPGSGLRIQCDFHGDALCDVSGEIVGWNPEEEERLGIGDRVTMFGDAGSQEAFVASDGKFHLGDALPGSYRLRLHGAADQQVQVPELARHHLIVTLPDGLLAGVVRTAAGTPGTEGHVFIVPPEGAATRRALRPDGAGRFTLPHAEPGTYTLEWKVDEQTRATLEGIILTPGGVLEGLVLQE